MTKTKNILIVQITLTNLCMALLNFSLSCFNCSLLLCFCAVYVKAIQYNAMHKFVRILDNRQNLGKINHTKFGYLMTV